MGKIKKGRRKDKLIEAFKFFGGKTTNKELQKYFLDHYKKYIFRSIKDKSILAATINGQLQYCCKLAPNFKNKYDLFENPKLGEWILKNNYKNTLSEDEKTDLKEQEELLPLIKNSLNREQIIKDLQELSPQDPELIEFKSKKYKRDNKSIIELKILRNFKCQICGLTILKKDNSYYIEAAHITEKKNKGPETPDNIIILCPNHHKEFDLGKKRIIERNKEKIIFNLNGKKYDINLTLK